MNLKPWLAFVCAGIFSSAYMLECRGETGKPIRAGMVGLDTSHAVAFAKLLKDPQAGKDLAGLDLVAGYPVGSPDIPDRMKAMKEYTETLRGMGVEIVDSMEALLERVDVVLIESVDGRPHWQQAKRAIEAGKPVFIDKPLAASLADAMRIFRLAKEMNVPCFSSSSLRFGIGAEKVRNGTDDYGKIKRCTAWSPLKLEPHHPDLFWYGVHGVEILYTVMGTGCKTVRRAAPDKVLGVWADGREGIFVGKKNYGATIEGEKRGGDLGKYVGYAPLLVEIVKFFKTGKPPVDAEETLEIIAFMEAADASKNQGGAPVSVESVMKKAREEIDRDANPAAAKSADAAKPVIAVPANESALQIAVDLPKDAKPANGERWQLKELGGAVAVPAQLVPALFADGTVAAPHGKVVADIPPRAGATGIRRFVLEPSREMRNSAFQFVEQDANSLKLLNGDKPVFVYNHGVITNERVPATDSRRSRACYIHPLWGLNGELMTDDFPRDHYHHHGIFWAWPHVGIGDKQYDLWEYRNIRQRFVRWLARETGPVAAVLGVENGWFVGDKKVMIERVWMQCRNAAGGERSLDMALNFIPVGEPIALRGAEGKSYGGMTVRFAVKNSKQTTITVPSGVAEKDLPETPLPWADLTYTYPGASEPSGAAFFVPKEHPDYPPTWLTRHYGPLCIGWPGVKDKTFAPGKSIQLDYRVWMHKTAVSVEALKQAYDAYLAASQARSE
ncbi:MAG: PmoA family protein [Pirellulales bacterium]|nr:PmoA family protein [Pirellulales bacterium]